MHTRTPRRISEPIIKFCRELVSNPQPVFLNVTPIRGTEVNDCFRIIERHVRDHGGSICYGWQIWEWPNIMVEAEFHAVWRDPNGALHDLTPKALPIHRILFLPDPVRVYEGRQVNNIRRAISSAGAVKDFIEAADAMFEFMNRGERANQHGQLRITAEEAIELKLIRQQGTKAYARILASLPSPGRNDPCPCGSGRKFKKCHGKQPTPESTDSSSVNRSGAPYS